jgi:hypothetical protein
MSDQRTACGDLQGPFQTSALGEDARTVRDGRAVAIFLVFVEAGASRVAE